MAVENELGFARGGQLSSEIIGPCSSTLGEEAAVEVGIGSVRVTRGPIGSVSGTGVRVKPPSVTSSGDSRGGLIDVGTEPIGASDTMVEGCVAVASIDEESGTGAAVGKGSAGDTVGASTDEVVGAGMAGGAGSVGAAVGTSTNEVVGTGMGAGALDDVEESNPGPPAGTPPGNQVFVGP